MSCGPSSQEKLISGEQQHIGETLQANANERFAQQTQILDRLNQSYAPIVAAGPSQQGFSPQLLGTLRSQSISATGAAARQAQMSAGNILAGRGGGGDSGLSSGIERQIRSGIASSEALTGATNLQNIDLANYKQGAENYQRAMAGRSIKGRAGKRVGGVTSGYKNVESGHIQALGRIQGVISGRKATESGRIQGLAKQASCTWWNIRRGKPCVCGKHIEITSKLIVIEV